MKIHTRHKRKKMGTCCTFEALYSTHAKSSKKAMMDYKLL